MAISRKWWKILGFSLGAVVALVLVVRTWVIPALIVGWIEDQVQARATIQSWWLGGRSAGIVGLAVHEARSARSDVWLVVDRVTTDLSIWGLLRGRFSPGRVEVSRPQVALKTSKGAPVNLPRFKGGGKRPMPLPRVVVDDARLTFVAQDRPAHMAISGIRVEVAPDAARRSATITGATTDPTWGRWDVSGQYDSNPGRGRIAIRSDRFVADPVRLAEVPFLPAEIWRHVAPRGALGVQAAVDWQAGDDTERSRASVRSDVALLGTSADFPSLGIHAVNTSGHLKVEGGGLVRVEHVEGETLGGRIAAEGTLDFHRPPYAADLTMELKQVRVEDTPKSWELDRAGITGLLSGRVHLRALVDTEGRIDLSGTTGEGVVTSATLQGIPVKSLKLQMRTDEGGVKYETNAGGHARVPHRPDFLAASLAARLASEFIAFQAPPAQGKTARATASPPAATKKDEPARPSLRLPSTITTQIELEDVELAQLVAKAQVLTGFPFPIPVTGKLTLKAEATIPLGRLADFSRYVFHGTGALRNASIFKVDIGLLSARVDMENGVLELKDLRGVLVNRPHGGPDNPPRVTPPEVPAQGPLPSGGFRGDLRAELSPPGKLSARFEGNQLPLSELVAPVFPRPTPVDGLATMRMEAEADLRSAIDPAAWSASGEFQSVHITYRGAALDGVSVRLRLQGGRLEVPALSATLGGRPLNAHAMVDLKPPRAFEGAIDVEGWDLERLVALIPSAPHPSPLSGTLTAHASARGTLDPRSIETSGRGQVAAFRVGAVPVGDVPFRWTSERDTVAVAIDDARPFGGRLTAQARVPVAPGRPIEGTARFVAIDTARLSAAIPGSEVKLGGRADGRVTFRIPPEARLVDATIQLDAPDLTVQGIPAEHVQVSVRAEQGALRYEITADSLGGKVRFQGSFPLAWRAGPARAAEGELRVVGFTLEELAKALHLPSAVGPIAGVGAIDANVRDVLAGRSRGLWAHGYVELRDLRIASKHGLGRLRGIIVKTPSIWRIERLSGELLGGEASGMLWGTAPESGRRQAGFNVRIDRAAFKQVLELAPPLQPYVDGYATIAMAGSLDRALRAEIDVEAEQGRVAGYALSGLKLPVEVVMMPETGSGTATIRRAQARLSGGRVEGEATLRIGVDRSFRAEARLADLDLNTIARLSSDASQPPTGKIGGRASVSGTDPARPESYRGRFDLTLSDASLFSIPVFREIERFLGAARGGLFEQGELIGAIANRQFVIEELALEGRLVQLHATGTAGFDGQLNLEVLVNTSQIIPETGQALVDRIPGLRDVLGRNKQVVARVGTYLSNRLLKLRIAGTIRNPSVVTDPGIIVGEVAVSFFADVLKLPLGLLR